jgi:DNA-binding NtrC family response regulator
LPADPPFVHVNCGSLGANFEHLMMGTVKGVFTDVQEHVGYCVQASYGTLFLDEIADLPDTAQAQLLTFLDSMHAHPTGMAPFPTFTRVVAATNKDLDYRVSMNLFKHDLLARFALRVELPSLAERGEDELEALIDFVAQNPHVNPVEGGKRLVTSLTKEAMETLKTHDYSLGNFRELEQVVADAIARAIRQGASIVHAADIRVDVSHDRLPDRWDRVVRIDGAVELAGTIVTLRAWRDLMVAAQTLDLPILMGKDGRAAVRHGEVTYVLARPVTP